MIRRLIIEVRSNDYVYVLKNKKREKSLLNFLVAKWEGK